MIIDEQFKTLIPPLTDDEFKRLEENILKEGIRDKLVVWDNTLIDGHNRYRIATEHGLTYETIQKDFESREHALNWIISNQLGRRNLNPNQIAYLRGKRKAPPSERSRAVLDRTDSTNSESRTPRSSSSMV